eukprot:TRINITY_DN74323_c0_g1_i1.p1 TRINITY_DN74323_c0_g1~~TRINITY_DN74323_c0_g1_i1.p1  ORF type:complete len:145 (-),score=27.30 TRINITY_DN74323_c0_g1_i1:13-447(-)
MVSKVFLLVLIVFSFTLLLFDVTMRVSLVGDVFRKPGIEALRQLEGIAGFQNPSRSSMLVKKSYSQYKLKSGIMTAISRLNYEFSNLKDSIHANDVKKNVRQVKKPNRNKMNIVGNLRVGEKIPVNSTRQIIIATSWRSGSSFL